MYFNIKQQSSKLKYPFFPTTQPTKIYQRNLDAWKITLEDFIQKWLKDYAEHELAPKTLFSYKDLLEKRIIPALGHIKLNKLQPTHLNEFYNNLRENRMRLDKKYITKTNFLDIITESGLILKEVLAIYSK